MFALGLTWPMGASGWLAIAILLLALRRPRLAMAPAAAALLAARMPALAARVHAAAPAILAAVRGTLIG